MTTNAGHFRKGEDARRHKPVAKAKQAPGFDAVQGHAGTIQIGDRDRALQGSKRWQTFAQLHRLPPVAVWGRLRNALFSGVKWTVVANESESPNVERAVELVEQGLTRARLKKPFNALAAESMQGAAAFGYSIHALAMGRTRDGEVKYTDIALRPQHSIDEWHRKVDSDPASEWTWVRQRVDSGRTQRLDLADCLYVTNTNGVVSSSPTGVGMLELIWDRARLHGLYERIEGTEIFSSMGGIPIARIPLGKLLAQVQKQEAFASKTLDEQVAIANSIGANFETFIAERYKNPETLQYFVLDSATYTGSDANVITSIYEWGLEIIKGDLQGLVEIAAKERALILDVARMLGVEHMFIGGDSTGAYSMHESKIQTLAADLNAELELWSYYADQQLVRPLIAANGLDPDEDAPSLQPSSVMPMDVLKKIQALAQMGLANLPRNGAAEQSLYAQLEVPWEERPEPAAPRMPFGFGGLPQVAGAGGEGEPDPDDTEETEETEDEEREEEEVE